MLKVKNLSKSYKNTEAVNHLSFSVEPGEILGLLGSNGAGKTTTLRAIAGVIAPKEGTIEVGSHDLKKSPVDAKRLFTYLPDQTDFFNFLTCWEHIRFVAGVYGVQNFEARAEALLNRFELTEKKNAFPTTLSKGMKQRLGIICALLPSPKLLLLDEPMTGLDPKAIRTLNEVILEESKKGTAIILSSHLLSILEEVCTKVLVLDRGQLRLYGTLDEIRSKSQDLKGDATLEEIFFYATKDQS